MTARLLKPLPLPGPARPVALPADDQVRALLAELRAAGYSGRALVLSVAPAAAQLATAAFLATPRDQRPPLVSEILEEAYKLASAHYGVRL